LVSVVIVIVPTVALVLTVITIKDTYKLPIRHNQFVVNALEGAISGEKGYGKTSNAMLKASRQKHRN
jgi:hypothetical protein